MAKKITQALGKGMASLLQANASELKDVEREVTPPPFPLEGEWEEVSDENRGGGYAAMHSRNGPKDQNGMMVLIDVHQIHVNPFQPRRVFDEKEMNELSESIKENGVIQPIIVSKDEKGFELIAGERRWRAATQAGLAKIPAVIRRSTEQEKLVLAIIENVQRAELNCVEEALAYQKLLEEFKLTQEDVAKKVGKERSSVANFLRILKLPKSVQEQINKGLLNFGHAKVLASLKSSEMIRTLADEVIQKTLSVRELEKLIVLRMEAAKGQGQGDEGDEEGKNGKGSVLLQEKLDQLRANLEKKTGFHFNVKMKKSGVGEFTIKFQDQEEFNNIYDYFLK